MAQIPIDPPHQTPSDAIRHNKCPACLGGGRVFNILADREADCYACGGSGSMDDVWRRLHAEDN